MPLAGVARRSPRAQRDPAFGARSFAEIERAVGRRCGAIERRWGRGDQAGMGLGVVERRCERIAVDQTGAADREPQKDPAGGLIREIDFGKVLQAMSQEVRVVLRPQQAGVGVKRCGRGRIDIHPAVALDVEHAFDVQHVQHAVAAESDRARTFARRHAVVEQFEMHALVAALCPGEDQVRHSGVGLDAVRQRIVDSLVPPDLQPALPRPLHQGFGRRDHEEEVDIVAEPGEEVAAGLVRIGGEAVEAEPVDQEMRHLSALRLARHVAIELLVDDLQFLARERAAILVVTDPARHSRGAACARCRG